MSPGSQCYILEWPWVTLPPLFALHIGVKTWGKKPVCRLHSASSLAPRYELPLLLGDSQNLPGASFELPGGETGICGAAMLTVQGAPDICLLQPALPCPLQSLLEAVSQDSHTPFPHPGQTASHFPLPSVFVGRHSVGQGGGAAPQTQGCDTTPRSEEVQPKPSRRLPFPRVHPLHGWQ